MIPGDVVFTKKLRVYANQKVVIAGEPQYGEARAEPGHMLVLLCLGAVPKGVDPDAMRRMAKLGYVPREGYPNPDRFDQVSFYEACRKEANVLLQLEKTPGCVKCGNKPMLNELGEIDCGCRKIEPPPYADSPNSASYALACGRTWVLKNAAD
jgi:hypothetical protein